MGKATAKLVVPLLLLVLLANSASALNDVQFSGELQSSVVDLQAAECCDTAPKALQLQQGHSDESSSVSVLESLGIDIDGMLWQTVNTNSRNPANPPAGSGNLPGGLFLYRGDEYMLNWLGVRVSRAATPDPCGWNWGGAVHAVYGTDYFSLQSRGLEQERDGTNRWNSDFGSGLAGGLHGLALPELYGEAAHHDISLKFGKFFHPLGFSRYEPNLNNIANTRSYGAIYGEFATVTGLQVDWRPSDNLTLQGAIHRGDANWEDNNDNLSTYFGFDWRAPSDNIELRYVFDVGREDDAGLNDQYIHAIVYQMQLADGWLYLLHNNLGWVENSAPSGGDARWYSIEQHVAFEVNEQLVVGMRYEWFDDIDGARVFPTPGPGVYHLLDFGGTYKMTSRLWFRPELRWEWFDAASGLGPGPFGDGQHRSQFIGSMSMFVFF